MAAMASEQETPQCRRCGGEATVLLYDDYWLCKSCSDQMGREAMGQGDDNS
jgi:ribosomal protein L37AE/L43A